MSDKHDVQTQNEPRGALGEAVIRRQTKDSEVEDHILPIGQYSIGRNEGDLTFPLDKNVSRKHARLDVVPGAVRLTDLGSTCGTFTAHGIRLQDPFPMRPNDTVRLGNGSLTLVHVPRGADGLGHFASRTAATHQELPAITDDMLDDDLPEDVPDR
jgi:pSer/pThr/pTyr-binding forkhead associated (FHA) protein